MAVSGSRGQNVQIVITLEESFMNAVPEYFQLGSDGKLHHDPRKVNVFAHKKHAQKSIFADSYGEVLTFNNPQEFSNVKTRLLTNPIFLQVRLEKEKTSGNTRYITRGSFVVFINTQHPTINRQLREKLDPMQVLVNEGKNVALEISFNRTLKTWFISNFKESWASYTTENSNFCITNYSQRYHDCYNPLLWALCLPCCLLGGPFYCIHRKMNCIDINISVNAHVQYSQGISEDERRELMMILARAYVEGINAGRNVVSSEPTISSAQPAAPPPYSAVVEPTPRIV